VTCSRRRAVSLRPVCALAADGASNGWGGSWDAPDLSVRADVRQLVRSIRSTSLDRTESRALVDALASDDPCVRHLAGTLIGRSGDRSLVPELTEKLRSSSSSERAGAVRALGLLGDRSAVDAIVRTLRDATPAGAGELGVGARPVGRPASRVLTSRHWFATHCRKCAARPVVALGHIKAADNTETLLRVLRDDASPEVRRVAAWALGELGSRVAAEGLSAAMRNDKTASVREMAAWALGEIHARDFADALIAVMRADQDESVRETAAWALGELEVKKAADALADVASSDKSAEVRGTAAWAIGQLNPGRAPKGLMAALRDSDDDVRLKAAWALSQIGDADVVSDVTGGAAQREERTGSSGSGAHASRVGGSFIGRAQGITRVKGQRHARDGGTRVVW
jgi:HEAT repeat protein